MSEHDNTSQDFGKGLETAADIAISVSTANTGHVVKLGVKLLIQLIALLLFFVSVFLMHPSFLYDNPSAVHDREVLEDTYNLYYDSIKQEYRKDISRAKIRAAGKMEGYLFAIKAAPSALLEGTVRLSDGDAAQIRSALNNPEVSRVIWETHDAYLRTDEEYIKAASGNINLVLCMLDMQKKSWFTQLWDWVLNSSTGGWYPGFVSGIERRWEGFWNDFIADSLHSASADVSYERVTVMSGTGAKRTILIATVHLTFTFDLTDKGVGFYAGKLNLNEKDIDRAAEMAAYLGDLFGSIGDEYFAWYVLPGYHQGAFSGGTTSLSIQKALANLGEAADAMTFDPDSSQVFPLVGYDQPMMSSPYGPRLFPSDPFHTGIDFAVPAGTPIVSAMSGIVLYTAQSKGGFGNHIVIYHGDGVSTLYAHMLKFGEYRAGDRVNAGDVIGYVGSTGLSTGNHLHFQLNVGNEVRNPVGYLRIFDYLKP